MDSDRKSPTDAARVVAKEDNAVEAPGKGSLFVAYLSVFIDMLGLSLIIPIIPFLALRFGADSTALGYIYASYNGAQMISVPITGYLSDKYGRKPMILASLFGSFIGFLIQGLAQDILTFCLGRALTGLFGGSVPIVNAYICDTVPAPNRPKYFAQLGAVIIVAFMFGPGIGAGLAQFSLETPMFVACGTAGFGFLLALVAFKEPKRKIPNKEESPRSPPQPEGEDSKQGLDVVGHAPTETSTTFAGEEEEVEISKPEYKMPVRLMYVIVFLYSLAFSGYIYYVGLLVFDLYGWESLEYGFLAMGASIWTVLNQMSSFVMFQKKFGKHASLMVGSVSMAVAYLCISFWGDDIKAFTGLPLIIISIGFLGLGLGFGSPSITSITSRYASKSQQGSVLGTSMALRSLGSTIGPLLWGVVYSIQWELVFILCCALCVVMLGFALWVFFLNKSLPEHKTAKKEAVELTDIKNTEKGTEDEVSSLRNENKILRNKLKQYQEGKLTAIDEVLNDEDTIDALAGQTEARHI